MKPNDTRCPDRRTSFQGGAVAAIAAALCLLSLLLAFPGGSSA